ALLQFFIMAGCGPACAKPAIPSRTKARAATLLKWVRNSIPFSSSQEYWRRTISPSVGFIRPREFGQILFCTHKKWAARRAAHPVVPSRKSASRAAEHRDCAAVLRPAGDIITNSNRTLLAIRDGTDAVGRHTLRSKEVAGRSRATCAKRQVVFA